MISSKTSRTMTGRVAAVVLVLAMPGCGSASPSVDPFSSAASGLCEASAASEIGDFETARRVFYDTAHQPLHELASEATAVERSLAARLLEAKRSVESGLDREDPDLADSFRTLLAAAAEALTATGYGELPCPGAGS